VATSSAQEIVKKLRDDQLGREDRVLKDTGTIRSGRWIFKPACKDFRGRGEGKG